MDELRQYQALLLRMLSEVTSIAYARRLPCFVAYGTALGAVRTGELIPWDRDVDLAIPIDRYEAVCDALESDLSQAFELRRAFSTAPYEFLFSRVAIRGVDHNLLHIDLFPVVGAPRYPLLRLAFSSWCHVIWRSYFLKMIDARARFGSDRRKLFLARVAKFLLYPFRASWLSQIFYRSMTKYDPQRTGWTYNACGSYGRRELFRSWVYGEGTPAMLESVSVTLPSMHDSYLRQLYGDYMTPPSDELIARELATFRERILPRLSAASSRISPPTPALPESSAEDVRDDFSEYDLDQD